MHEDELKAQYKASSQEQSPPEIDAHILAEARAAVTVEKPVHFLRRGWKPVLATAASVTIVVSLAFQLIPMHEQQWPTDSEPLSTTPEPAEVVAEVLPERQTANDRIVLPDDAEELSTFSADSAGPKAIPATKSEPVVSTRARSRSGNSAMIEAHTSANLARQKRLEASKKQRLSEQQRLVDLQAKEVEPLTDKQLLQELLLIQKLLNEDKKQDAELAWLKLQSRVTAIPQSGAASLMWNKVAKSFE